MRKIKNNFKTISAALLSGTVILGAPAFADEINNISLQNFDLNSIKTCDRIEWSEGIIDNNNFNIILPDGTKKYYSYEYQKPENLQVETTRINNITDSINNKLYRDIVENHYGGAIYNSKDISNLNITADFVNNTTGYGGAIYNEKGSMGIINGNFLNNTANYGSAGAINNASGNIKELSGDYIGNSAMYYGGAIFNASGVIETINVNFINNTANNYGGAISNYLGGNLINISSNFISNNVTDGYGGGN